MPARVEVGTRTVFDLDAPTVLRSNGGRPLGLPGGHALGPWCGDEVRDVALQQLGVRKPEELAGSGVGIEAAPRVLDDEDGVDGSFK
jgi:hypothetical protein